MNPIRPRSVVLASVVAASALAATAVLAPAPTPLKLAWQVVVNNATVVPGSAKVFNSYNQPAVNEAGLVAFRARSKGPQRESGVYARQLPAGPVRTLANLKATVPAPNNTLYPVPDGGVDRLATFIEFPSTPRLSPAANVVATRGNHRPVWTPPGAEDERAGSTGVYVDFDADDGAVPLVTGASKLGASFAHFAVPGAAFGTPFDVFPGSPAVMDDGTIAFKGNFTEAGVAKTGVFYRVPPSASARDFGAAATQRIADTDTPIPDLPPGLAKRFGAFGSTSPLAAAGEAAVFVGVDDEANPRAGGIYLAPLDPLKDPATPTVLTKLVGIGLRVPGLTGPTFTRVGEGLAFDGRFLAFWGAWGRGTRTVRLTCPDMGNAERVAFCKSPASGSTFDPATGTWFQDVQVPINQGVFVLDTYLGRLVPVATAPRDFEDFLFWNFSGRAPGATEEDDGEPARWRGTAYVAVAAGAVAFKAASGPQVGVYLQRAGARSLDVVADTTMPGTWFDPLAVDSTGAPLPVTGVGLVADGFRGRFLALAVSMGVEEGEEGDSWAGLYVAELPPAP